MISGYKQTRCFSPSEESSSWSCISQNTSFTLASSSSSFLFCSSFFFLRFSFLFSRFAARACFLLSSRDYDKIWEELDSSCCRLWWLIKILKKLVSSTVRLTGHLKIQTFSRSSSLSRMLAFLFASAACWSLALTMVSMHWWHFFSSSCRVTMWTFDFSQIM